VPSWVRVADGLTLALLALWLRLLLMGPLRTHVGTLRFTITDPTRLVIFLAGVIIARHTLWRRPTLWHRALGWARRLWRAPGAGTVLGVAACSRVAVLAVGLVAVSAFGLPPRMPHITVNPVRDIVTRWDALWYWSIVYQGYEWQADGKQHNVAFFPGFPMVMGAASQLLGWHPLHAGLVVSLCAFVAALAYLHRLARDSIGSERASAAIWLLAAYPFSVYYSAPYTESLYLLAVVAAIWHYGRSEWALAAMWGFLAGATRPNGCFLSIVLAIAAAARLWRERPEPGPTRVRRLAVPLAVAAAPGLGMLAFSAYLNARFGDPFLWMHAHTAWGRTYTSLVDLADVRATTLRESGILAYLFSRPYEAMNTAAAIFALIMVIPVWRRLGTAYAAFIVLSIVPPLVMGGTTSLARVSSTLFPVFIVLAAWAGPPSRMALLATFGILQGMVAALFFTWRPIY